jgi:MerR family redox-sensitive transcriptional activator SoxR
MAASPYKLKSTLSQGLFAMANLTIGAIARRAGMRPSAIRYYEKVGLLPQTPRVNGRRRYDEMTLERLAIIRFAKWVGFSVAEITILLNEAPGRPPPERWQKLAHDKVTQLDRLMTEASAVRQMLLQTLDQKCPKLVERGRSLGSTLSATTANQQSCISGITIAAAPGTRSPPKRLRLPR